MQRPMSSAVHLVVLAELFVLGGSVNLRSVRHEGAEQQQFFSYDYSKHGQDWSAGSCSSRARQSPIDLPATAPVTGSFAYKYNPIVEPFELMNNGHAFSADLAGLGYGGITYENAWYNLLNINVHSLSEHSYMGFQMPLELHLVHKRYDGDALLVVAIAIESPLLTGANMAAAQVGEGAAQVPPGTPPGQVFLQLLSNSSKARQPMFPVPATPGYVEPPATEPMFNPTLQAFLKTPPPPVNMKVPVSADSAHSYDLNALMQGAQFYEYAGSLTAPPCAEIVTWLVRKDTLKASDKQVMYLHDAIYKTTADFGNFRSLMPLNGRIISLRQSTLEDLPPTAAPPVPMPGKPQQSDREFRAMKWAMDAMVIAKSATDYVKDLDSRLRNAAQAHANALAPQLEPLKVHGQVIVPGDAAQAAAAIGAGAQDAAGVKTAAELMGPRTQTPLEMQKTAETMARTLATAAREEIEDATQEISKRSKEVAMQAAREAANLVMNGGGNPAGLTTAAGMAAGAAAATPPAGPPPGGAGPPPGTPAVR